MWGAAYGRAGVLTLRIFASCEEIMSKGMTTRAQRQGYLNFVFFVSFVVNLCKSTTKSTKGTKVNDPLPRVFAVSPFGCGAGCAMSSAM